jgi:hypothetical protein
MEAQPSILLHIDFHSRLEWLIVSSSRLGAQHEATTEYYWPSHDVSLFFCLRFLPTRILRPPRSTSCQSSHHVEQPLLWFGGLVPVFLSFAPKIIQYRRFGTPRAGGYWIASHPLRAFGCANSKLRVSQRWVVSRPASWIWYQCRLSCIAGS